jgi:hypothetical protein
MPVLSRIFSFRAACLEELFAFRTVSSGERA